MMKKSGLDKFIENMMSLHNGSIIDLYDSSIDAAFERLCGAMLKNQRGELIWYDGTNDLEFEKKQSQKLLFKGTMHVAEGQKKHWKEPFSAEVTVGEKPKDCNVSIKCGAFDSSSNLYVLFGYE